MKLSVRHRLRTGLRRSVIRNWVVAYRFRGVTAQDVLLATYPKSGATWLTFMLSELIWGVGEQQDIMDLRFIPTVGNQRLGVNRLPSGGWLLRTHERYRPCCKKAIYVVRDGRDVAVSLYFQIKRALGMDADFSEFLEYFLAGHFVGAGPWGRHVDEWLDSPCFQNGSGLLVRYEDMQLDARRELERCAEFLDIEATPERVESAIAAGSFDSMRKTEKRSEALVHNEKGPKISFVRKGVVGDWQNHFSAQDLERFNAAARPAMERLGYDLDEVVAPA